MSKKGKGQDSLTAIFIVRSFDYEPDKISFLVVAHFFSSIRLFKAIFSANHFRLKSFYGLSVKTIDISKVFGYTILNKSGGERHDYPTAIFKHAEDLP